MLARWDLEQWTILSDDGQECLTNAPLEARQGIHMRWFGFEYTGKIIGRVAVRFWKRRRKRSGLMAIPIVTLEVNHERCHVSLERDLNTQHCIIVLIMYFKNQWVVLNKCLQQNNAESSTTFSRRKKSWMTDLRMWQHSGSMLSWGPTPACCDRHKTSLFIMALFSSGMSLFSLHFCAKFAKEPKLKTNSMCPWHLHACIWVHCTHLPLYKIIHVLVKWNTGCFFLVVSFVSWDETTVIPRTSLREIIFLN